MLSIFNLESYKEHLISYATSEFDNCEERKLMREKLIAKQYSDEYLQNIINNTKNFISDNLLNNEDGFFNIDICSEPKTVFTNLIGGYSPDTILSIENDKGLYIISKYLLKMFLGKDFRVEITNNEFEYYEDVDSNLSIGSIFVLSQLYIIGNFKDLEEKFKNENELTRTLKK